MNSKTLEALEGSIEKWEGIVRSTEAEDRGVSNCPLCHLFHGYFSQGEYCIGCPVREKTGMLGCLSSPFDAWINHHETLHRKEGWVEVVSRHKDCPECLRLAKAELEFLKGLLPKEREVLVDALLGEVLDEA